MEKQSQGCYKTMQLVFVTAITKKYGYSKWIAWRHQAIIFHADSEVQWYSSEVSFNQQSLTLVAHLNIQFNLPGANELKTNILHKVTSA